MATKQESQPDQPQAAQQPSSAFPWVNEAFETLADLELADKSREIINNERTLRDVRESDSAYRALSKTVLDAQARYDMERIGMKPGDPSSATGATPVDDMGISIRSPVNHTHNYPAPKPNGIGPLATALLVAAAIAAGGVATYFLTRPDTPIPIDPSTYGLGLLPPDEPKAP